MTDDELIEAMARGFCIENARNENYDPSPIIAAAWSPEAKSAVAAIRPHLDALRARAAQAEAERNRLREALAFYANPEVYAQHPQGIAFDRRDLSFRARAALEARDDAQ